MGAGSGSARWAAAGQRPAGLTGAFRPPLPWQACPPSGRDLRPAASRARAVIRRRLRADVLLPDPFETDRGQHPVRIGRVELALPGHERVRRPDRATPPR
jgi:hypothetical protein